MSRLPRAGTAADRQLKVRLTDDEHARYSAAALAAGYRMPVTAEHPEPRGAVGAWMRSLAESASGKP